MQLLRFLTVRSGSGDARQNHPNVRGLHPEMLEVHRKAWRPIPRIPEVGGNRGKQQGAAGQHLGNPADEQIRFVYWGGQDERDTVHHWGVFGSWHQRHQEAGAGDQCEVLGAAPGHPQAGQNPPQVYAWDIEQGAGDSYEDAAQFRGHRHYERLPEYQDQRVLGLEVFTASGTNRTHQEGLHFQEDKRRVRESHLHFGLRKHRVRRFGRRGQRGLFREHDQLQTEGDEQNHFLLPEGQSQHDFSWGLDLEGIRRYAARQ